MPERRPSSRSLRAAVCSLAALHSLPMLEAADLTIRHDAPDCMTANGFPRLVAQVDPAGQAVRVRVAFRPETATVWHGVTAEAGEAGFTALLPRPRPVAQRIHYRFEATGPDAKVVSSADYTAAVVADASACTGAVADSVPSARVLVDVPPGAPMVPPVPAGFDPVGAVASAPHRGSKGKRLGLLAGVLVGGAAVAGGVIAAKSEPAPTTLLLQPTVRVNSSSPPLFGQVSVAQNSMTAEIAVVTPRNLQAGEAWFIFFNQTNPPERPCAVLTGPHQALEQGREARFVVRTPFVTAAACGLANFGRLLFRGTNGQTLYSSGNADLADASVSYTFVP